MAKMSLSDFARPLVASLPQVQCSCRVESVEEKHYTFSAQNLPEPPPLLATSDLVMAKTEHHYGNCCRIDTVHFYAAGQTHRELGVLILTALFSEKTRRVAIDLEHESSAIKRLEINCGALTGSACLGYTRKPQQFTYHPEIPDRIPWDGRFDERDLPLFDLDFREGTKCHPVNDLDKRDKVEVKGGDEALILVAELLLNIGLPACDVSSDAGSTPSDKTW